MLHHRMLTRKNPSGGTSPTTVGAVRFGATAGGERLRPGTVFTSSQSWSACMWAKLVTDRNDYSGIFAFEHGGHSDAYQELITNSNGTTMAVYHPSSSFDVLAMTTGVWYFFGIKVGASGACSAYYGTEGTGALTKVTGTVDYTGTFDQITIGATNFSSVEYWNGDMAQVRAWNAELSDAEFYTEKINYQLQRTSNILGDWKLDAAGTVTVDSSGLSNTLGVSGFGSFSTQTGPTIG